MNRSEPRRQAGGRTRTGRLAALRLPLFLLSGVLLLFGGITLYALEGHEVVVLRTRAADGAVRETRTWIAEEGGVAFVESAHAQRPFFQQLLAFPEIEVVRAGRVRRYHAAPVANPAGHAHIRRLLAEKYGWADAWIGLLQDTSQSVEVRLEPLPAGRTM